MLLGGLSCKEHSLLIIIAGFCISQIWKGLFDFFGILTGLQPVHHFVELGRHLFTHFPAHLAHHPAHRFGIIFQAFESAEIIRHRLHAAVFRFRDADLRHAATDIFAVAVCTFDGFLSIFGKGEECVKALVTVVADKVIGWHKVILTESSKDGERRALWPLAVHNGHSTGLDMG